MKQKGSDDGLAALINAPIIEGYKIQEWTIAQFSELYPYLKGAVEKLQSDGATIDNIDKYLGEDFPKLLEAILPILPQILSISLSLTKEEADNISAAKASILGTAILKRNMEHFTTFLSQLR